MNVRGFCDPPYFEVSLDALRSRRLERLDNMAKKAVLMKLGCWQPSVRRPPPPRTTTTLDEARLFIHSAGLQ